MCRTLGVTTWDFQTEDSGMKNRRHDVTENLITDFYFSYLGQTSTLLPPSPLLLLHYYKM